MRHCHGAVALILLSVSLGLHSRLATHRDFCLIGHEEVWHHVGGYVLLRLPARHPGVGIDPLYPARKAKVWVCDEPTRGD
jgi:hypothetical protein